MGRAAAAPKGGFESSQILRFSSAALPELDRMSIWREEFGRKVMRVEVDAISGTDTSLDATALLMPQAAVGRYHSRNVRLSRTPALLADGNTDLHIMFIRSGRALKRSARGEQEASRGSVLLGWQAEPREFLTHANLRTDSVILRQDRLSGMIRGGDESLVRPLAPNSFALKLLGSYIASITTDMEAVDAALMPKIVDHLYDLAALALGARTDAAEQARDAGVRQARLAAMKTDLRRHLDSPEVSADWLATRHDISPSYVRRIFEAEGLSVSKFVLSERLDRARRLLLEGLSGRRTISWVAYHAGFSDLSYFNRAFKQRFGITPSDVALAAE